MKTHFKKLRNPDYLGSWDLADQDGNFKNRILTIKGVEKKMVHDGKGGQEECVTVAFHESKPMVMNSTNLKTIWKSLDTPYIEDWVGKKIELTVQKVKAFGEVHDALRVVKTSLELTPKHPKWNGAKEAIKAGTVTIEQIKKQYTISPENEKLLCS
jgi:FKBP-type peptidyl-prolyl cis-trans isomerase 2